MEYKGLKLDAFQEKAINAIEENHSVVVSAPTGSGKTLIADYIIDRDFKKGIRVIYTAPIKALSNQKYKEFSKEYGEKNVGILTGDNVKNPDALILIMTTEIYRNMAIANDPLIEGISYVIFDEIHYINDVERGYVWEESIIFSKPSVRILCLSATIPNAEEFAAWISTIKKHNTVVIRHDERFVPLHLNLFDSQFGITTLKGLKDSLEIPDYNYAMGKSRTRNKVTKKLSHIDLIEDISDKLPCLFFCFSRMGCQKNALSLLHKNIFKINPEITSFVRKKLSSHSPEINNLISTRILRQVLPYGIGFHHAGLLPVMKEIVEDLFSMGLVKVLYTTETFAVGINMPAKTVCFESLRKFDGVSFRLMNSKEYFQIAGRAGRRGIDKEGFVFIMVERNFFDYGRIKHLTSRDTEPIRSQFKLSINTVLNLVKRHSAQEIDEILKKSFHSFQKYGRNFDKKEIHISHSTFSNLCRKLEKMGYLANGKLTQKGEFASKIYSDEILFGEIFSTDFYEQLNEYQMLILVACICYESRERTEFKKIFPSKSLDSLKKAIWNDKYLSKEKRLRHIDELSGIIHPCYHGSSIFRIMQNSNIPEGDLIRFFRQIIDRLGQIKSATADRRLADMLDNCQKTVLDCIKEIGGI